MLLLSYSFCAEIYAAELTLCSHHLSALSPLSNGGRHATIAIRHDAWKTDGLQELENLRIKIGSDSSDSRGTDSDLIREVL